jgi:tetratricopeptide (TPR) repeat protein
VDPTRPDLRRHFEEALPADPGGAYRDWFRAQAELRERGEAEAARALADDFWRLLPDLPFRSAEERARFLHNAGVFYGSPGPAADLGRARNLFGAALEHFEADDDASRDWRARAHHNLATAISNLAGTPEELAEAAALFERALEWRDADRAIARGVTLHNMGIALRRLADLDPSGAAERLASSALALQEAVAIRERHGLEAGRALSETQLEITMARLRSGGLPPQPR